MQSLPLSLRREARLIPYQIGKYGQCKSVGGL